MFSMFDFMFNIMFILFFVVFVTVVVIIAITAFRGLSHTQSEARQDPKPQEPERKIELRCPYCGAPIHKDDKKCLYCDAKL